MPLYRRLPTRGFSNVRFADKVAIVNVSQLDAKFEDGATVDAAALRAAGLVKGRFDAIKVLGNGELGKKLTVSVPKVSASARAKIEKAGGVVAQG
jgi:large subunit ribosomal protein L15